MPCDIATDFFYFIFRNPACFFSSKIFSKTKTTIGKTKPGTQEQYSIFILMYEALSNMVFFCTKWVFSLTRSKVSFILCFVKLFFKRDEERTVFRLFLTRFF